MRTAGFMSAVVHTTSENLLTITPKLRLSDADKNVSLSAIEKSCMRGNCLTMISTHIMLAPTQHAGMS